MRALVSRRFQQGESPNRGLLRDCETLNFAKVRYQLYDIMMIRCGGPLSNTAHHHITAARDLREGDISTSLARVLRGFLEV